MPDGIHCGPFNVSSSLGLHPRSGVSALPTANPRLGQVYTQVDGHLGYMHPSGTLYTLTPPGGGGEANTASNVGSGVGWYKEKVGVDLKFKSIQVNSPLIINDDGDTVTIDADIPEPEPVSSGVDGMWKRYSENYISPINESYGITVNSGTELLPGVSLPIGGSKGLYATSDPIPLALLGITFEGQRSLTIQDFGFGAGQQIHVPKHEYGPTKPRIAGEGTSGTGLYFPGSSGIGLSSEGEIGIEINREGANMQARMPAGGDTAAGISFANHHFGGLQLQEPYDGGDQESGKIGMMLGVTLQSWSGTQVVIERNTRINGNFDVASNGNLSVLTGSVFVSGTLQVNANAFFNNDVFIAGNLDPKSVRFVPQVSNPASQNQGDYVYSRIPDGNRLFHGTSGIAYTHELTTGSAALPTAPATDIASQISSVPRWFRFDVDVTDVRAAGGAGTQALIDLDTLPVKGWIHGVHWKYKDWSHAAEGGSLRSSLGSDGNYARWVSGIDIWSGGENSINVENAAGIIPWEPDFSSGHSLKAFFSLTLDNFTNLQSGSAAFFFLLSSMNEGMVD